MFNEGNSRGRGRGKFKLKLSENVNNQSYEVKESMEESTPHTVDKCSVDSIPQTVCDKIDKSGERSKWDYSGIVNIQSCEVKESVVKSIPQIVDKCSVELIPPLISRGRGRSKRDCSGIVNIQSCKVKESMETSIPQIVDDCSVELTTQLISRGRGRSKMVWSGIVNHQSCEVQESVQESMAQKIFKCSEELIPQIISDEVDKSSDISPVDISLVDDEVDEFRNISTIVQENKSEIVIREAVKNLLTETEDPYLTVLKICVYSSDFKDGKYRGVSNVLLAEFENYLEHCQVQTTPSLSVQDAAFVRFCGQPSVSVMKNAFRVFNLISISSRYKAEIVNMCVDKADYKTAADAAVALSLFDRFSIDLFCFPLLLLDKPSTMDSYLDRSPNCARDLVVFLDDLTEDNLEKVSSITSKYSQIKPVGVAKLCQKPLEKLIKKLSEKHNLDTKMYPKTAARRAAADLYYWVKQMFGLDGGNLTLINWRELIDTKVRDSPELQVQLVNNLLTFDINEARFWARRFNSPLFDNENKNDDEEEDWETEETPENKEVDDNYYELSVDNIIFVDTIDKFRDFLTAVHCEDAVGVDAEFMSKSNSQQQLSLFQVATDSAVFLLDFETLPNLLTETDYIELTSLFTNQSPILVGFGIWTDIKLLGRFCPQLSNVEKLARSVLNLEMLRTKFSVLLELPLSQAKGLSGFCQSVLGLPLCKTDQISDWTRRPLRPSQITYAALDAYVCLEIYRKLKRISEIKHVEENLEEILKKAMAPVVKEEKVKKPKEKVKTEVQIDLPAPLHTVPVTPGQLRLVCDDMLQGLCKKLRMFGVDCLSLENGQDHMDCISLAKSGGNRRYVLSRGVAAAKLAKHLPSGHCLDIRPNEINGQVEEVFRYFAVTGVEGALFSRCVLCNGGKYYLLRRQTMLDLFERKTRKKVKPRHVLDESLDDSEYDLDKFNEDYDEENYSFEIPCVSHKAQSPDIEVERWRQVEVTSSVTGESSSGRVNMLSGDTDEGVSIGVENVPKDLIQKEEEFWVCGNCGKVYWQGSHWGKAKQQVNSIVNKDS